MPEVRLRYTEPLLREAVRFFVVRSLLRRLGVLFFIVSAVLIGTLGWLVAHHDRSWRVGLLAAFVLFIGLFLVMVFVAHHRNTIGRFRRMRAPEALFGYDEEEVRFTSELGGSTLPWSAVAEVWRHDRFWLLLFSESQFVTLPLDCLDEPTRAFITRKTNQPKS